MTRQQERPDFRADFSRRLRSFMDEHACSTIELSKEANVRRETVLDAAENRREMRPATMERLAAAMESIKMRRVMVGSGERPTVQVGMVVTEDHPSYAELLRLLQHGTIVMAGRTGARVFRVEQVQK